MHKTIIDNLRERIEDVPFKIGGEGTAFMFENYILKKYHPFDYWDKNAFEGYFRELQRFYNEGCSVPRVFDWKNFSKEDYFMLQERLSTKEIYPTGMNAEICVKGQDHVFNVTPLKYIFAECEGFCDKETFINAIDKADPNDPIYTMIVLTYLKIYLETTKKLESISDLVLDKFVTDDAYMTISGEYGIPDIHSGNVFTDRNASSIKEIQIIDNYFLNGFPNDCLNNEELTGNSVFADMFYLFKLNTELKSIISDFDGKNRNEMELIVDENMRICEEALLKFTGKARTIVVPGKELSRKQKIICTRVAEGISGKDGKLIKEIERQFY